MELILYSAEYDMLVFMSAQLFEYGEEDDANYAELTARAQAQDLPVCLVTDWVLLGGLNE